LYANTLRARVIALLAEQGVRVEERSVRVEELETAREIFSTGSYGKVTPCTRYEGHEMAAGPVARKAPELYLAFTETT
jgi:branched-chain amino acid aminotransferase